jgi:hypothetical protein
MKTLITKLKDPKYYNVYYNHSTNKLQVIKTAYNPFRMIDDEIPVDDNLVCVFTINPVLIGMLRTLSIPFYKAKNRIISAINKDLSSDFIKSIYDKNSNLYNLLINEFHLPIKNL